MLLNCRAACLHRLTEQSNKEREVCVVAVEHNGSVTKMGGGSERNKKRESEETKREKLPHGTSMVRPNALFEKLGVCFFERKECTCAL